MSRSTILLNENYFDSKLATCVNLGFVLRRLRDLHTFRDGDFANFSAFADFFFQYFQSSAFLRISAVSSFNQREREKCGKNAYKITLTEPQREMRKNVTAHKKISLSLTEPQLCEPLNCERHGQCTLSFC